MSPYIQVIEMTDENYKPLIRPCMRKSSSNFVEKLEPY